jgi:PhoPQ-activated pathogenicity-related protein
MKFLCSTVISAHILASFPGSCRFFHRYFHYLQMKLLYLFLVSFVIAVNCAHPHWRSGAFTTPLDDYVNAPDPSYAWTLDASYKGDGYTWYVLNLTSQTWMTEKESNKPVWTHWLVICVPQTVKL